MYVELHGIDVRPLPQDLQNRYNKAHKLLLNPTAPRLLKAFPKTQPIIPNPLQNQIQKFLPRQGQAKKQLNLKGQIVKQSE
jgi:hypothetical protein